MFPRAEITKIGGSFALIITESGKPQLYRIAPIQGRAFYIEDLGLFQLNKENRYISIEGKSELYFFDQKSINPLKISAMINMRNYIKNRKKAKEDTTAGQSTATTTTTTTTKKNSDDFLYDDSSAITLEELALMVPMFSPLLDDATVIDAMRRLGIRNDKEFQAQIKPFLEQKIIDNAVDKLIALKRDLKEDGIKFLNRFYEEDDVLYNSLVGKYIEKTSFKIKKSTQVLPWIPQSGMGKRDMAIVIIDDRAFDIVSAVVEYDVEGGTVWINCGKYGRFQFSDTKTRYRYGGVNGTNLYIVAVQMKKNPNPPKDIKKFSLPSFGRKKKDDDQVQTQQGPVLHKKPKNYIFVPADPETISIHASTMLPKINFIDPGALRTGLKAIQQNKVGIDEVTADAKISKKWDIKQMMMLLILGTVGLAILYSGVIEPAIEQQQAYELELKKWESQGRQGSPPTPPNSGANGQNLIENLNPFS